MPRVGRNIVMGVRKCDMFRRRNSNFDVTICEFRDISKLNPTSLTICASLQTYIDDMDIEYDLSKSSLKWIDMMCNQGKALREFTESGLDYKYVIGVEPNSDQRTVFEYHKIYVGDPATVSVKPKPNLITSRYGFYYANIEAKMKYLKQWFDLLEKNGIMVIYPYFTKTSIALEQLDWFIDECFENIERKKIKKDLVRLTIAK